MVNYDPGMGMSEADFDKKRKVLLRRARATLDYLMRHSVGILVRSYAVERQMRVIPRSHSE